MKRNNNYFWMLTAAAVGILMEGCVKETGFEPGGEILFSASSSELETRTVYGAFDNETNPTKQYINWVAGDKMTIVMDYGGTKSDCDYTVQSSELKPSTSSSKSVAKVLSSPKTGQKALTWGGTGTHDFYAMYPAGTYSDNQLQGTIEATQVADMSMPYGYMFATDSQNVTAKYDVKTVDLEFDPAFTAFEFVLTNPGENDITLSSFKLTSSTKALNGTIAYNWSSSTPSITHKEGNGVEAEEKTITVTDIGTIASGQSATFIITTLPNDFSSADMTIICTPTEGEAKSLNLVKTVGSSTLTFGAGYKHKMTIDLPTFQTYTYGFDVLDPIDLTSSAASATSNTATVTSWKSSDGGTTKIPVDWTVLGYYSDEQCTTAVSDNWITDFTPSGSGEVKSISINYNRADSPSSAAVSDITAQLRNSTFGAGSTSTNPYNLSNPSDMTSDFIVESANCYIVNGPGWYRIPLVMGNGVKGNVANTSAFQVSGYKDFNNNDLGSSSSVKLKDLTGNPDVQNPRIVWTDVDGLVSETSLSVSSDDNWLIFEVPSSSIAQGNAVISVTNGTNIMWSYHIWVTNHTALDDFSVKRKQGNSAASDPEESFTIMPYYLGWITTGGTLEKYGESTIFVKLKQTGTNSIAVMKVFRPSYIYHIGVPVGTCTNYQWGRKDPFVIGHFTKGADPGSLYKSIRMPSVFNNSNGFGSNYALWSTNYSSSTDRYTDVSKSIYDPCPAGYKLLEDYAFGYSAYHNNFTYSTDTRSLTDGGGKSFYLPLAGYITSSGSAYGTGEIFFGTAFCNGSSQYYTNHGGWSAQGSTITNCMPILPVKE